MRFFHIVILVFFATTAKAVEMLDLEINFLRHGRTEIIMHFSREPQLPKSFVIASPSSLILDFSSTKHNMSKDKSVQSINKRILKDLLVLESEDKTRLILNLTKIIPYDVIRDQKTLILILDENLNIQEHKKHSKLENNIKQIEQKNKNIQGDHEIKAIDFRRGSKGEGRLIIDLSIRSPAIDMYHEGEALVIEFPHCLLPKSLQKRFDVLDFGTPMREIKAQQHGTTTKIEVRAEGPFDRVAYQLEEQFILEFTPLSEKEIKDLDKQRFQFTGEKISLNFQNIDIRSVLQILADYTGLNMVATDAVTGSVTLRLEDIPWDQALDFILKSKGLSKIQEGDILLIAPAEEIAARELTALESEQDVLSLTPLKTEYIDIHYANAAEIASFIKAEDNSLLSDRGNVTFDERTNTLLIQDTSAKIGEIRDMLTKLDVPVDQVMIEIQLVDTKDNFTELLGIGLTGGSKLGIGKYKLGIGNNQANARQIAEGGRSAISSATGLFVDLITNATRGLSNVGLALAKLPGGTILDLELSALEKEGKTKIISKPKLLTVDGKTATIEQGLQIPYQVAQSSSGGNNGTALTTTEFKDATLTLEVTPQVSPANKVLLELSISQDSKGENTAAGPSIDTKSLQTTVLVENNQTIILGGIFKNDINYTEEATPFFSKLPLIGRFFKNKNYTHEKNETMIFVTPRIIHSHAHH